MEADLAEAKANEEKAIADYKALVVAKKKEIEAATKAIEDKMTRVGELGVEVATMINDLEDTKEGLEEDKKFLADMDRICEQKKKEWAVYQKMMAEELLALADTIKLLNDDDALDLFKKTLPSAASFLQLQVSAKQVRSQALAALSGARTRHSTKLDLLEMALRGKTTGFDKVIKMIDSMVALLKKEQLADEKKKEWCEAELDTADDQKKAAEQDISDLEKAISSAEEAFDALSGEIEALTDGIKKLDKEVVVATEQRKEEHENYSADLASNQAAVELLEFAKNRLNKFYNPKLYKEAPKRELSEEERITVNNGGTLAPTNPPGGIAGTDIGAFLQVRAEIVAEDQDAPPPPPEADLTYGKKGEESGGVIQMIELLKTDLSKEISEMQVEEKEAQADYEKFIADSAEKRAKDAAAIEDKEGSKATLEQEILTNKDALKEKRIELMETEKYIAEVHGQCDWLLNNFDLRTQARADEA